MALLHATHTFSTLATSLHKSEQQFARPNRSCRLPPATTAVNAKGIASHSSYLSRAPPDQDFQFKESLHLSSLKVPYPCFDSTAFRKRGMIRFPLTVVFRCMKWYSNEEKMTLNNVLILRVILPPNSCKTLIKSISVFGDTPIIISR